MVGRYIPHCLHDLERPLIRVAADSGGPIALDRMIRTILAGQQSTRKRPVGHDPQSELFNNRLPR